MVADGTRWYPGWLLDRILAFFHGGRGPTGGGHPQGHLTATVNLSGPYPVISVANGTPGATAQLWANAQNVQSTGTGLYYTGLSATMASDGSATITDTTKGSAAALQYGTNPGVVRDSATGQFSNWVQPW